MLLLTLCFLYLGISAWQQHDQAWHNQQSRGLEYALHDLHQEQEALRLQAL